MTIKQISLLSIILAVGPAVASQQPKQNRSNQATFSNNGAILNQGTFVHHGPFRNNGLVVNAQNAYFQTGNAPHYQQQPQYPNPYARQQMHPQYQSQLGSFYSNPQIIEKLRQQNPEIQIQRPLTPQQKANIEEMEQFAEVRDLLDQKFQRPLKNVANMAPAEKSLVAEMLVPKMKEDETVQDLKKVMHVFTGTNKEQNLLPAQSSEKVNTDHPLFFFNKAEKSLFRETPNTPFEAPKSPRKLFYTPSIDPVIPAASPVCNQLQLSEGQPKAPIHAAAFGKWTA